MSAARLRGQEYLLERRLFRRLSTGEMANPRWLYFAFPYGWHYDVLRALDYLRDAGVTPDERTAEAIDIVDYWHATEHVWTVARALLGKDSDAAGVWAEAWCIDLLEHGPQPWLAALRSAEPPDSAAEEVLRVERGYFTTNAARMDYPTFRAGGLPIGSGAVESAAKHVVQVRMKRSGMRWSNSGGQAMLALCAYLASNRALPVPDALPSAA